MIDVTSGELGRWLMRVEAMLDKVANDHETRLRRTERVMYVTIGLAIAAGASGVSSILVQLLGGGA
jgi:hypothetical protein